MSYGNNFANNSHLDHHLSGPPGPHYTSNHGDSYPPPKMRYNLPSNRPSPYDRNYSHRNQAGFAASGFARAPPPTGGSRRGSGLWDDYDSSRGLLKY